MYAVQMIFLLAQLVQRLVFRLLQDKMEVLPEHVEHVDRLGSVISNSVNRGNDLSSVIDKVLEGQVGQQAAVVETYQRQFENHEQRYNEQKERGDRWLVVETQLYNEHKDREAQLHPKDREGQH